jgi:hypothetical protein
VCVAYLYRKISEAELLTADDVWDEEKIREEKAFFTIHWLRKTFNNFPYINSAL